VRTTIEVLVGLIGGVGAALIGAWAALRARRPRESRVELVDLSLPPPDPAKEVQDDLPVLDFKVRNTGGQPAVLKRVVVHTHRAARLDSMWLMPYKPGFPRSFGARLEVSETYDVTLPAPEEATGTRVTIDLSQVVKPGEADRFLVRLGQRSIHDTAAYLLHFELVYNADDRKVTSPPLAVAPQRVLIESVKQIRRDIHSFLGEVNKVRQAIDREMAARGRPTPDWITAPPRHRDELPGGLLSVDGDGDPLSSGFNCVYVVNENFWDPQRAIERHLHTIEKRYQELVEVITPATVMHKVLRAALQRVHATLAKLPALYAEFCPPGKAVTVRAPAPTGDSEGADHLARLLAKLRSLEELRVRADSGDQTAAYVLHLTIRLAKLLEDRGSDDPKTLDARHLLAAWQAEVDHAGAATAFAELLPDLLRVQGPDHPDTLVCRHELARWRGVVGDATGAAAAFAELLPDLLRIRGPDHLQTLFARHNLARWRGEAGDATGAAAAFAELLPDLLRVLGPDHPKTLASQRALAHWQDQARPR